MGQDVMSLSGIPIFFHMYGHESRRNQRPSALLPLALALALALVWLIVALRRRQRGVISPMWAGLPRRRGVDHAMLDDIT